MLHNNWFGILSLGKCWSQFYRKISLNLYQKRWQLSCLVISRRKVAAIEKELSGSEKWKRLSIRFQHAPNQNVVYDLS